MRFRRSYLVVLVSLLLSGALLGCNTRGQGSIPPNVNNIFLENFQNETNEPGLEDLLTDEATEQLLSEGQINVVRSRDLADVIVRGIITSYKQIPLVYNDQDIVQLYKIRTEISLKMLDPENGEILRKFEEIFRETRYSDVNPPVETEFTAQQRVIRLLARDTVTTVVEGWPYLKL